MASKPHLRAVTSDQVTEAAAADAKSAAEGTILVKFWMHLSPEEQLRRFEKRRDDPYKTWKLTDEDWRNREKRPAYEEAVEEMLERTDHPAGPWHVVAAEDKRWARVDVVRTVVEAMEKAMAERGIDTDPPLAGD